MQNALTPLAAAARPPLHGTLAQRPPAGAVPIETLYFETAGGALYQTQWTAAGAAWAQVPYRTKLTAARTYYVRTDGSDSNTGLVDSAGGGFLTIQKAVDVASALDNGGFAVTIQVRDGTYSAQVLLKSYVGSGALTIQGNSGTPANVLINPAMSAFASAIYASEVIGAWTIKDLKISSTAGSCLTANKGSQLLFSNINFGAVAASQFHLWASFGGAIGAAGNYSITGGAGYHVGVTAVGLINCGGVAITLTGTPAFSYFAFADRNGEIEVQSMTFTGAATGPRYLALQGGGIYVGGAGATYLPGNAAGTATSPGWYG